MKLQALALCLAAGLVWSTAATAADIASPVMLGNTCAGCHGTNGSSVGPATPSLAGMSEDTIIEAMEAYKSGDRPSTIMGRIAKGYNKAEIEAMAKFFTTQKMMRYPQEFDKTKAKAGEKLHKDYCEKCHEDNGKTDEDGTGILAGQWAPYLRHSFADFQAGHRDMPKKMKKRMQKMLKKHGKDSIENVIHFYISQN